MRKLIVALIVLVAVVGQSRAADTFTPHIQGVIETYIRPAFNRFSNTSSQLPQAVKTACLHNAAEAKQEFANTYRATVIALGNISFLRFGPLAEENRLDSLAFMPDPRGIAQRQIRKALAANDQSLIDPAQLSSKSVALQGLTALQLIAFDKDGAVVLGNDGNNKEVICGYALAIASNIVRIAQDAKTAWEDPSGFSADLLAPNTANDHIRSSKEAMETIVNALATGLTIIKDQHILPAMGTERDKARPHRFPFSRSQNGVAFIYAELEGIKKTLAAAKLEGAQIDNFQRISSTLEFEFKSGLSHLNEINAPIRDALKNDADYNRLKLLPIIIDSLRYVISSRLAGELGLSGGFNALDGD